MPLGKGVSFYKINDEGKISYVRECPEHFAKIAFAAPPVLSIAAPLLRTVGSWLQEPVGGRGFNSLAQPEPLFPQSRWTAPPPPPPPPQPSAAVTFGSPPIVMTAELSAPDISGAWTKDMKRSDLSTYDRVLEMMGIRGIQKTTARMIDGVELSLTDEVFTMRFLTVVPYFKVTEVYRFDEQTSIGRRDLREGWQRGLATFLPDGRLQLTVELGPENGWKLTDVFERRGEDELLIHSTVEAGGRLENITMVYTRGHN